MVDSVHAAAAGRSSDRDFRLAVDAAGPRAGGVCGFTDITCHAVCLQDSDCCAPKTCQAGICL